MGRLLRGTCGCGNPTLNKGKDEQGRTMYRSQCYSCLKAAKRWKKAYCEWCFIEKSDDVVLDIDHIDGNRSNNVSTNLQTLCRNCHIQKTRIFGDIVKHRTTTIREIISDNKFCRSCNSFKDKDLFYKSSLSKDGLQPHCADCQNTKDKIRREQRKSEPASKIVNSKVCKLCNTKKPASQFGKRTQSADKLMTYCKLCWTDYVKKRKR